MSFSYVETGNSLQSLKDDDILSGVYEVERMGVKYKADIFISSPFDPTFRRMMGKYNEEDQVLLQKKLDNL